MSAITLDVAFDKIYIVIFLKYNIDPQYYNYNSIAKL